MIPYVSGAVKRGIKSDYPLLCPIDHFHPIRGVVPEEELSHPRFRDEDNMPCIPLIKNGTMTKTTVGHGTGIKSVTRQFFPDGTSLTSMELAITGVEGEAFSGPGGDSGAIIVDTQGRAAPLLTGGCSGRIDSVDITYGTPFEWLLDARAYQR